MIYKFTLIVHLIGFSLIAGSTVFSFLSLKKVLKPTSLGSAKEIRNINSFRNLGFGLGMAFQIISGFGFIVMANGYVAQPWFRLKVVCIVLLILNALVFGRKVLKNMENDSSQNFAPADIRKFNLFYSLQFVILLTIITLSAYKFS